MLDEKLLKAIDAMAKRRKMSRSALIRVVLAEHLKSARTAELEERDRRGYQAKPEHASEYVPLERTAAWPEG